MNDKLAIAGREFESRFILGSGKYDLELIRAAVENAKAEIITLSDEQILVDRIYLITFPVM